MSYIFSYSRIFITIVNFITTNQAHLYEVEPEIAPADVSRGTSLPWFCKLVVAAYNQKDQENKLQFNKRNETSDQKNCYCSAIHYLVQNVVK